MINTPVSVIITCFNLEAYIQASIESAINQDYPGEVEILVIDDHSADSSNQLISAYNNIIHIPLESNQGVLKATIAGIQASSHSLLFFLNGDDIWEPTKLSNIVPKFQTDRRLALVTHDLYFIDANGFPSNKESRPNHVMSKAATSEHGQLVLDGILHHHDYVWLGSAFAVHRELGNLSGFISFVEGLSEAENTYQDWPLAFWVACQSGITAEYVSKKLFSYRLHGFNHSGDSSSLTKASRNFCRSKNTLHAIYLISKLYLVSPSVQTAIQARLAFYSYLVDLYSEKPLQATLGFVTCFPSFAKLSTSPSKELFRFILIQLLGAQRFISIANSQRLLRHSLGPTHTS